MTSRLDREIEADNAIERHRVRDKRRARWMVLGYLAAVGIVGVCGAMRGF